MTAIWQAPDGEGEPTVWTGDPERPDVLLRRCDAPRAYDALVRFFELLDREYADTIDGWVRSAVGNVRCLDCDLRYDERDQYGCGQEGYGHHYDAEDLAEAEAKERGGVVEYVTLKVANIHAAMVGSQHG